MPELNPVLVKELRGRMRGMRSFIMLTIFLGLLGGATLIVYMALSASTSIYGNPNRSAEIGQFLFLMVSGAALVGISIITPTLSTGALAGERERQTLDLLLVSQLSPWQIVMGKLGSSMGFALLIVVAVVPFMSISFLFGGVSLTEMLIAIEGLAVSTLLYTSIGLFWSSVMRTTLGATSLTMGTVALLLLGIPFLMLMVSITSRGSDWFTTIPMIYISITAISAHPFIALGMTEAMLRDGQGALFMKFPIYNSASSTSTEVYMPSSWLIFTTLAVLASAVLLLITVSRVRPGGSAGRRPNAKAPTQAEG